jgi:hypothetical protein
VLAALLIGPWSSMYTVSCVKLWYISSHFQYIYHLLLKLVLAQAFSKLFLFRFPVHCWLSLTMGEGEGGGWGSKSYDWNTAWPGKGREFFPLTNNQVQNSSWLAVWHSLIIKDDISPHGWQIYKNNGAAYTKIFLKVKWGSTLLNR